MALLGELGGTVAPWHLAHPSCCWGAWGTLLESWGTLPEAQGAPPEAPGALPERTGGIASVWSSSHSRAHSPLEGAGLGGSGGQVGGLVHVDLCTNR